MRAQDQPPALGMPNVGEDEFQLRADPPGSGPETTDRWMNGTNTFPIILTGHSGRITAMAFSPSPGCMLLSISNNQERIVWDTVTGCHRFANAEEKGTFLSGHDTATSHERHRASLSPDGTVTIEWFGDSHPPTLLVGLAGATGLAWSRDGRTLASGSTNGTVRIWRVAPDRRGRLVRDVAMASAVNGVALSSDGRLVAAGLSNNDIAIAETATNNNPRYLLSHLLHCLRRRNCQPPRSLSSHGSPVTALDFSDDDQSLASGSQNGSARIWIIPK